MVVNLRTKTAKDLGLESFKQIGMVRNTGKVPGYFEKTLGLGHFGSAAVTAETDVGKIRLKVSLAQLGETQFELIEPPEGETVHSDYPKQGREGLHHLGFHVSDIKKKL